MFDRKPDPKNIENILMRYLGYSNELDPTYKKLLDTLLTTDPADSSKQFLINFIKQEIESITSVFMSEPYGNEKRNRYSELFDKLLLSTSDDEAVNYMSEMKCIRAQCQNFTLTVVKENSNLLNSYREMDFKQRVKIGIEKHPELNLVSELLAKSSSDPMLNTFLSRELSSLKSNPMANEPNYSILLNSIINIKDPELRKLMMEQAVKLRENMQLWVIFDQNDKRDVTNSNTLKK